MGFRMRKSFKIAPGVRLNVSKSGIGASVGTRGVRYSVHSSGRRTRSVGLPGTGIGYVSTTSRTSRSRGSSAATRSRAPEAPPTPRAARPKPGLFAPKGEKALYRLIRSGQFTPANLDAISVKYPNLWLAASTIVGLQRVSEGDTSDSTITQLQQIFDHYTDPAHDPFIAKYLAGASYMTIGIAPGVTAELPFSRDLVGLALTEVLQERGRLDEAIDVVERVTPTAHAAVSLRVVLRSRALRRRHRPNRRGGQRGRRHCTAADLPWHRVHAPGNVRGCAGGVQGGAEVEKARQRDPPPRPASACRNAAEGKKAQARKDLERILAEDASIQEIRERIDELSV